ncbi:MAG: hypothetical protein Q8P45_00190 [Candidatus Harrisonbacteria bacterium]|nr:hypothetical protein [Candidatus Harrisonbacteria bacterium]
MKIRIILVLLILLVVLIGLSFFLPEQIKTAEINSFEDCVAAGNPVMESYPRQCRDKEGNLFVEVIPNNPASLPTSEFSRPQEINLNQTLIYPDGLMVELLSIEDSRCPGGAVCIWAGEINYLFSISSGRASKTGEQIQLSTGSLQERTRYNYRFLLLGGDEHSASIQIENNEVSGQGQTQVQ